MTARPPSPRAWRWSALERAGRPCRTVPAGRVPRGEAASAEARSGRRALAVCGLFADDHFLIRAYANHATLLPCTLKAK
jgi:hypothetical protein